MVFETVEVETIDQDYVKSRDFRAIEKLRFVLWNCQEFTNCCYLIYETVVIETVQWDHVKYWDPSVSGLLRLKFCNCKEYLNCQEFLNCLALVFETFEVETLDRDHVKTKMRPPMRSPICIMNWTAYWTDVNSLR